MKNAKNITTLFLLTLLVCLPSYAKMSPEANKLYQEAIKFENYNRFDDAIDLVQKALNNSKDEPALIVKLAGLYARNGEFDNAVNYYNKAIEQNPNDAFLYISLGNIYQQN